MEFVIKMKDVLHNGNLIFKIVCSSMYRHLSWDGEE